MQPPRRDLARTRPRRGSGTGGSRPLRARSPSRARRRWSRGHGSGDGSPGHGTYSPTANRSLLLERPRLLPPALNHQVRRGLGVELDRRSPQSLPERVEIEGEDVAQALDPGLDQELVLVRSKSSEIEQERLVAPGEDIVRRRIDLVGER